MTAAPRRTWLHLGVVPTRHGGRRAALLGLASDQYAPVPGLPGAFIDGSWEVWGKPEENPRSLHLLTCANPNLSITRQADPPPEPPPPPPAQQPPSRPRRHHHRRLVQDRRHRHLRPVHRLLHRPGLTRRASGDIPS